MHIKVNSEEELLQIAKELLHFSYNCRFWQKEWQEHHGGRLLEAKRKWEEKLDELHERLGVTKADSIYHVHISIQSEE
jgi:hypothetical protein